MDTTCRVTVTLLIADELEFGRVSYSGVLTSYGYRLYVYKPVIEAPGE
jgi:hypothetical protein